MAEMHVNKRVSVIIPARNEEATMDQVLTSCKQIHPFEIIVVANGCTDRTVHIARQHQCVVIEVKEALGNDVGRAIGAQRSSGEILLFLDADFALPAERLLRFIRPLQAGMVDVVSNDFDHLFVEKKTPHSITVWRQVFNELIGRPDLKIDSLLSVPHAISRHVLLEIGWESLANPIVAHRKIGQSKFRIHHDEAIDVITPNRYRPEEHQVFPDRLSRSEQRMVGDHLEALSIYAKTPRFGYSDGGRRRDIVSRLQAGRERLPIISRGKKINPVSRLYQGKSLSIIIPAMNEEQTLRHVIREARKIEPAEVIVVVNGSNDQTASLAVAEGAATICYREPLGNDVGRAIGAMMASGDILLFIDGDFVIPAADLYPYARAVANGVDVAMNDLNHYLSIRHPLNPVTASKYAVNLAINRKDLGVGSLVAVPHAISRGALKLMGADSLVSPVVAQIKAALHGCRIEGVHRTEVDMLNRIRPDQHLSVSGLPPAVERIMGDHAEAISYLVSKLGPRGMFGEDGRNLNFDKW